MKHKNIISIFFIVITFSAIIISYHHNSEGENFLLGVLFILIGLYEFLAGFRKSKWIKTAVSGKPFYYLCGDNVYSFLIILGLILMGLGFYCTYR